MDSEKLKIFLGMNKVKTAEQARFELAASKIAEDAQAIRVLMESKGWKLLDEFFNAKRAVLAQELKLCKPKELIRLQEKSKIIDELYNFMNSKVLRDS